MFVLLNAKNLTKLKDPVCFIEQFLIQAAFILANRKELHRTAKKKRFLNAEKEQKKANYYQTMHCFRQGKQKESISKYPSAGQELPCLLVKRSH